MSKEVKLNLGAGICLLKGFVGVDAFLTKEQIIEGWTTKQGGCMNAIVQLEDDGSYPEYVTADICSMPFKDGSCDYALMDNVIEHLPMRNLFPALKEVRRVLKPSGKILIITPDFNAMCKVWMEHIASKVGSFQDWGLFHNCAEVFYGNQAGEGEYHRSPMTPDLLNHLLLLAGFENVMVHCHPVNNPVPSYDGNMCPPEAMLRNDTLFAGATVPMPVVEESPGGELKINVGDATQVKGGLR